HSAVLLWEQSSGCSAWLLHVKTLQNGICWTQFWSRPKWAPIKDMDRDMPRPTTRIELEERVTEVAMIAQQEAEIAELARRSRSRLAIKEGEETRRSTYSFLIELVLHFGAVCGEDKRKTSSLRNRSKFPKRDYGPQPNNMTHSFGNQRHRPCWIQLASRSNPGATGTSPTQRILLIGTLSEDRPTPINQTTIPEQTRAGFGTIPETDHPPTSNSISIQTDFTNSSSPNPRGTDRTLRNDDNPNRPDSRLDQAEKELAEYRAANARERNRASLDPLRATSKVQSTRLFGTKNPKRPIRTIHGREFGTVPTAGHRPPNTPIQFHNGSTERQGEPRTRTSHLNHSVPKNRTPSTTRTFHQVGLDNLAEQTRRHEPRNPINGQHSYSINNSPQKSSTYDLSKYCAFHDRKGHSTKECRAALGNQNENKKTNEEAVEEEEPVTPKSNRKTKVPTNKRGGQIEQESPSSPPPAPKKRVEMISWGQNSKATNKIKSQTERKIRFKIAVAIRTLVKTDEDAPPPQVMKYHQNARPPSVRFSNFKRKNKMNKIRGLLSIRFRKNTECRPSIAICLEGRGNRINSQLTNNQDPDQVLGRGKLHQQARQN
ncbi:hypothetical protein IGI04_040046, partial [Brassica rapa subsp. trilocularis]